MSELPEKDVFLKHSSSVLTLLTPTKNSFARVGIGLLSIRFLPNFSLVS